jgi:TIR domain
VVERKAPGDRARAVTPQRISDLGRLVLPALFSRADPHLEADDLGWAPSSGHGGTVADSQGRDFFISYTQANRPWAEWIVVQLEAAGCSTVLQENRMSGRWQSAGRRLGPTTRTWPAIRGNLEVVLQALKDAPPEGLPRSSRDIPALWRT